MTTQTRRKLLVLIVFAVLPFGGDFGSVWAESPLEVRLAAAENAGRALAEHSKQMLPTSAAPVLSWEQQMANFDLRTLVSALQSAIKEPQDALALTALASAVDKVQISLPKLRLDAEGEKVARVLAEELSQLQDYLQRATSGQEVDWDSLGPSLRPARRGFGYGYGWDWGDPYWGYSGPWSGPGPWGPGSGGLRGCGYPGYPGPWRY